MSSVGGGFGREKVLNGRGGQLRADEITMATERQEVRERMRDGRESCVCMCVRAGVSCEDLSTSDTSAL